MGTHPIFESDFDCLTDKRKNITGPLGPFGAVYQRYKNKIRSIPIKKQFDD